MSDAPPPIPAIAPPPLPIAPGVRAAEPGRAGAIAFAALTSMITAPGLLAVWKLPVYREMFQSFGSNLSVLTKLVLDSAWMISIGSLAVGVYVWFVAFTRSEIVGRTRFAINLSLFVITLVLGLLIVWGMFSPIFALSQPVCG